MEFAIRRTRANAEVLEVEIRARTSRSRNSEVAAKTHTVPFLQNPCGEMEIGVFFDFLFFLASLMLLEASLIVPECLPGCTPPRGAGGEMNLPHPPPVQIAKPRLDGVNTPP